MASGRVIFWTTASLEPQYEAVSKEVYALARHFPGSMICSISPHCSIRLLRDPPAIGLHPSFDLPLRALVPFAERCIAVNHVYAEFAPWTYVRTLRRKPTVLTIASEKGAPDEGFLQRVNAIAVQTVGMYERLARQPIWGNKVSLVFPGVDIRRFRKRERRVGTGPTGPRILFATFPRSRDEFEERGVNFLIEAARRLPWLQLTLIGRPWLSGDTASEALRGRLDLERPTNIDFVTAGVLDMAEVHASHDFVVVPYKSPGGGKECPLSMVEAMASGLPVLISEAAPFAGYVSSHRCGEVFEFGVEAFGDAVRRGMDRYSASSSNARERAEVDFDEETTFRRYETLYANAVVQRRRR